MADDPAAGQHPVRGDDHVRPRRPRDRLRRRGRRWSRSGPGSRAASRRRCSSCARLLVEVLGVAAIDVRRLRGHRRVEVERQLRDLAALDEPVELPDDLLRPADRERRDEQHARRRRRPSGRSRPGSGSPRPAARARGRRRSTRRGRSRRRSGSLGSRMIGVPGPAEVAGEDDRRAPVPSAADAPATPEADDRRAEDVAGVEVGRVDARRDLDLLVVVDRAEVLDRRRRVVGRCRAARRGRCRARPAGRGGRPPCRRVAAAAAGDLADRRRGPRPRPRTCPRTRRGRVRRGGARDQVRRRGRVLGQVDRRLVGRPLLLVVGDRLVGMLPLPARLALRELLLELAGVEQDELGQLARCRASRRSGPGSPRSTTCGISPQWSRWAWVRRIASRFAGSNAERDAVADRPRSGCPGTSRSR